LVSAFDSGFYHFSPLSLVRTERSGEHLRSVRLIGAQEQLSVLKSQDFNHRLVVVARSHRQASDPGVLSVVKLGHSPKRIAEI
jgi:hypothetical protein